MKLSFGGGASEIGASFLMLQLDGMNIALDCGVRMAGDMLPDLSIIHDFDKVDCILLSHAHMDHSGALPVLSREFPDVKIYMTHATKDLIRILLYDSLKIMDQRELEIPMYAEIHVEAMLDSIVCYSPVHTFAPIEGSNIQVTFYGAGHIAGAVGIFIAGDEGSFFYSGDFSVARQQTVEGATFPKLMPDVAVFESTYGDRLHSNRAVEEDRLVSKIASTISNGGKLLIPAFALGRSQEIILLIHRAINRKQLPKNLRVFVDGMVNDVCLAFARNPNYLRTQYGKRILRGRDIFYNDNVVSVNRDRALREQIVASKDPLVIISSSGMLNGGPSQFYAEKLAGGENNAIALTGYQDEESPGRQLMDVANAPDSASDLVLKLGDRTVPVKCDIGMFGLSAHADKLEILSLAQQLGARQVFFNHGGEDVVNSLGLAFQKEFNGDVYIPKNGEVFDLVVRNKRKQDDRRAQKPDKCVPWENTNGNDVSKSLWEFVLSSYGTNKAFVLEDLFYVCYGRWPRQAYGIDSGNDELQAFRGLINTGNYFETEIKRPFVFHAVDPDSLEAPEEAMEVNAMLALVDNYFPADSGLYKKGARHDEKIALLSFNFPLAAQKAYSEEIAAFEQESKWKTQINAECNPAAAEVLINRLIENHAGTKVSYFRTEGYFQATVGQLPKDALAIQAAFSGMTGLQLRIATREAPKQVQLNAGKDQMEQNQVFALIDQRFSGKTHKIYKKSIKARDGITGLELSFITPMAGSLYRDELNSLTKESGWPMWVNNASNQHELLKIAKELLENEDIITKKISFMPDTASVQVSLDSPVWDIDGKWASISSDFYEMTCAKLLLKQ
ncbi:MAG: MBL fold metallo-hydrolase [Eubacteriaceae bacterium]|nr:MBL fold metallo-hydrolase [Eubacteriaceae bacterium]